MVIGASLTSGWRPTGHAWHGVKWLPANTSARLSLAVGMGKIIGPTVSSWRFRPARSAGRPRRRCGHAADRRSPRPSPCRRPGRRRRCWPAGQRAALAPPRSSGVVGDLRGVRRKARFSAAHFSSWRRKVSASNSLLPVRFAPTSRAGASARGWLAAPPLPTPTRCDVATVLGWWWAS